MLSIALAGKSTPPSPFTLADRLANVWTMSYTYFTRIINSQLQHSVINTIVYIRALIVAFLVM